MEDKEGPSEEGVKGAFVVLKRVGMMPEKREQAEKKRRREGKERSARMVLFSRPSLGSIRVLFSRRLKPKCSSKLFEYNSGSHSSSFWSSLWQKELSFRSL